MKIILLSGGSGKRLWPLSNNSRSKQFLRLLQSPSGEPESMVQRVVRQMREANLDESVTVATSAMQRDIIINQLGDDVDIVTEPERRDTFPAIALATEYLAKEKGCPPNEVVVVMPCDPFTEAGYFETIARMAKAVEADAADLVLMGIRPTYPSTKFGYIVPNRDDAGKAIMEVNHFTEKPDEERARRLIEEGAFWNGGVFAFRLGYMTDIVRRYVDAPTFADVRNRYGELPKISFDYEVAEKAKSVAMIPFSGEWKDLGTWNALAEKLPSATNGNTVLGDGTEDTVVVNETGLPLLCVGTKNLIIAANPDGVLIADKDHCETIKSYVDKLSVRPMYEERRWGTYKVIDHIDFPDGHKSLTKQLVVKAGLGISYQIHHHRDEVWTFIDGEGLLALDGEVRKIRRGDVVTIRKGQYHAVKALTDLHLIEVQSGDLLVEEDIERFPWNWDEHPC